MAITDPAAIKFCNEYFRPASDKLAQCFYFSHQLRDSWNGLSGTNDERMALLLPFIRRVADKVTNTLRFIWWSDRIWQSSSMAALIPSDVAQVVFDNAKATAPDPSRPTITGQDCRRLKNRMEEFTNWLSRGTDLNQQWVNDATATLPITYAWFDDFARLAHDSSRVPTTAQGRAVAVDRCGAIVTQWETTAPTDFSHILRVSVNPEQGIN